uniref:Uncharacterized protein n=1 Tax=Ascaris lumbricoides TaxID=6252 RepID=A0A0M3IIZ1_ASCLU
MQSSNYYLPFLCRMQYQFSSNVFANISYFPSLPGSARNGGFYLNQIPNRTLKDIEGKDVVEKDGDIMYSLPPLQYQFSSNVFANISYFPSLPGSARNGGFYLNQIPNRTLKDIEGKDVVEKDGDIMYSLPPLLMVKLSFPKELGPFTIDCRIKDNVNGYEFNNLNTFKGQISVSFDFIPDKS